MARLPSRPARPQPAAQILRQGTAAAQIPARVAMPEPRPMRPALAQIIAERSGQAQADPMRVAMIRAHMAGAETRMRLEQEAAAIRARLAADPNYGPSGPAPGAGWDDEPIRQEVLDVSPDMLDEHLQEADTWEE